MQCAECVKGVGLDGHDVLLLDDVHVVDLLDEGVVDFLDVGLLVLLDILAEAVFLELLNFLYCVAPDVTDGDLGLLARFLGLLGEVASAFLGQWRNHYADDLAVVVGVEAYVGGHSHKNSLPFANNKVACTNCTDYFRLQYRIFLFFCTVYLTEMVY